VRHRLTGKGRKGTREKKPPGEDAIKSKTLEPQRHLREIDVEKRGKDSLCPKINEKHVAVRLQVVYSSSLHVTSSDREKNPGKIFQSKGGLKGNNRPTAGDVSTNRGYKWVRKKKRSATGKTYHLKSAEKRLGKGWGGRGEGTTQRKSQKT